jgi:formylmethanofuran dehydrogenase subunit E
MIAPAAMALPLADALPEPAAQLQAALACSAAWHHHLCPRQVLGARLGLAGAAALGLSAPRGDKKLLAIVETDGCFTSGVAAATGLSVHRRTLRVVDYGKIALTMVAVDGWRTGAAVRLVPRPDVRQRAWEYALPGETRRYYAMLHAYQVMPDEALLSIQPVRLAEPLEVLLSRPGVRTNCARCGEEIINERQVVMRGEDLCVACAGGGYYQP